MSEYVHSEIKVVNRGDVIDLETPKQSKFKCWWKYHGDDVLWCKQLYHDSFLVVDEWGSSQNPDDRYTIDITINKVFSLKNRFTYQIKAPNIVINDKNLYDAFSQLLRYLYHGGCPCYFRLQDLLIEKGLWEKL